MEYFKGLSTSTIFGKILRSGLDAALAIFVLGLFPYYPIVAYFAVAIGIFLLSLKYPTVALAAGTFLSVPAAIYQNTFFGAFYALLCLVTVGLTGTWLTLCLAILGWALAFSPLSLISFIPTILCGIVLGSKEGAKIGVASAISFFFFSWMRGSTSLGFIVVPYTAPVTFTALPIPERWGPLAFLYGSRVLNPIIYNQLWATLLRNFEELTFYIEIPSWGLAGYTAGLVARRWKLQYPWIIAAVVGFLPIASAYTFGASFFIAESGLEMIAGITVSIIMVGLLQLAKSDITRIAALQKVRRVEITAVAQPVLEKQEAKPEFAWDQIGGYEQLKQEIRDAVLTPLQRADLAKTYDMEPPRGILLFGPPGCGKTLFMKALAQTLKANFYYVKTSDILSKWYGESEKRVAEIFSLAKSTAPSILFFDEIDAIAKKRDLYGADDVTPRLLSLMLAEMDGMERGRENMLVAGATNKPELLDPAILRPGRFDRVIYVPPPDRKARAEILRVHCRKKPMAPDVDYEKLAGITERFSGADIQNVVQMATMESVRKAIRGGEVQPITMEDLVRIIYTYKPSITLQMLEDYEKLRLDFERKISRTEEELRPKVTFESIGGLDNLKQMLIEAVELPLKHPEVLEKYGLIAIKGILLFGPPGCGKTQIAKAAAGSLEVAFLTISGAELSQRAGSDAAATIKEVFYRARENAPSIIFIDEIETIAPSREIAVRLEAIKPISQLLTDMDGIRELKNVIIMAATNKPSWIDPALLRPGRFDKILYIPPPDRPARKAIFQIHLSRSPVSSEVDYDKLAEITEGYSGADIAAIVREGKTIAVRDVVRGISHDKITMHDLVSAIDRVKPSITEESMKECTAFLKTYGERA